MRVVECDICGETISAASDEELTRRLGDHLSSEHATQSRPQELAETVAQEAYEATDS